MIVDMTGSRFGLGLDARAEMDLLAAHAENQQERTGMPPHGVAMTKEQYRALLPFLGASKEPFILGLPIVFV